MPRSTLTLLLALPALVAGGLPPAAAAAHVYRPDELVVRYAPATDATQQQRLEHAVGASREQVAGPDTRVLRLAGGRSVADAARSLRSHHGVRYAVPNYVARAADTGFFQEYWNLPGLRHFVKLFFILADADENVAGENTCASASRRSCTTRSCASTSTTKCSTASTSTTPCCASAA